MKTLDEAIDTFARNVTARERERLIVEPPPLTAVEESTFGRYLQLMDEAYESHKVHALAEQLMMSYAAGQICCVEHVLAKMFCHGLRVGIEMERQELPL